jgi:hypothetical protein
LVTLNPPDFDDARLDPHQFEGAAAVKDGASIRPVVSFDVNARRIRFGEVGALESLSPQRFQKELVVIHFLSF